MKTQIKILLATTLTIFILLGFAVPVNMVGNWYQQFIPNLNGQSINDITFIDSLTGYAITNFANGHSYILKTTNSGDNWTIIYDGTSSNYIFRRVQFLNQNTGFVGGGIIESSLYYIKKTINGGANWSNINAPFQSVPQDDIYVLDENTIWAVASNGLVGGVFRTTDGGASWEQKLALGNMNPEKIYMYNSDTGFVTKIIAGTPYIRRTTNSGLNWSIFVNGKGFTDMFFVNSLTGWTAFDSVRKTTNGGLNWQTQVLPYGGIILTTAIREFSYINNDTIFGIGGEVFYGAGQFRGIIYRTTNGGNNWLFQVPDTAIHIGLYYHLDFVGKNNGWAYATASGAHTTTGGDQNWLTGIKQTGTEIPKEHMLHQNYPNPFNPTTVISYQLRVNSFVNLKVYDITGKHIIDLVNQKQSTGTYEVDFSGIGYSSGVYFYSLTADNKLIDTKRMVLVK